HPALTPPPGLPAPPRAPRARTLGIPPRVRGRLVFPPPRPPQVGPEGRSRTPQGAVEPRRPPIFANGQPGPPPSAASFPPGRPPARPRRRRLPLSRVLSRSALPHLPA